MRKAFFQGQWGILKSVDSFPVTKHNVTLMLCTMIPSFVNIENIVNIWTIHSADPTTKGPWIKISESLNHPNHLNMNEKLLIVHIYKENVYCPDNRICRVKQPIVIGRAMVDCIFHSMFGFSFFRSLYRFDTGVQSPWSFICLNSPHKFKSICLFEAY